MISSSSSLLLESHSNHKECVNHNTTPNNSTEFLGYYPLWELFKGNYIGLGPVHIIIPAQAGVQNIPKTAFQLSPEWHSADGVKEK
jgi:hypothetical protein